MAFLILSAVCFAMAAAGGYSSGGHAAAYPSSGHAYVPAYHDRSDDYSRNYHKRDFRKLKDLDGNFADAEIKYYKHKGDHYAVISCKPDQNKYVWILADSDDTIPSFGQPDTVALSGGINVQYVAKYQKGKWTGKDYNGGDKHKFRKVGCFTGTITSGLLAD